MKEKLAKPNEEVCGNCDHVFDMFDSRENCPDCGAAVQACNCCIHCMTVTGYKNCGPCSDEKGSYFMEMPGRERCVVHVSGGVAEVETTAGVEAVVLDRDAYKMGEGVVTVPRDFRDMEFVKYGIKEGWVELEEEGEYVHSPQSNMAIPSTSLLSAAEDAVVTRLADAWNEFVRLESVHPDEVTEFRRAIHAAQHIIMSRPVQRQLNADNQAIEGEYVHSPQSNMVRVELFYRDADNYKSVWNAEVEECYLKNLPEQDSEGCVPIQALGLEPEDIPLIKEYGYDEQSDHPYVKIGRVLTEDEEL